MWARTRRERELMFLNRDFEFVATETLQEHYAEYSAAVLSCPHFGCSSCSKRRRRMRAMGRELRRREPAE